MQRITVGIPTWNRSELLKGTLDQLLSSIVPAGVHREIIVADNNSTDNTQEVLEFFGDLHDVVNIYEPRQGRSYALNRIIERASGEYILWIDDDIRVDRDWMVHYIEAFRRWPNATVFGGTIIPLFMQDPPAWVSEGMDEIGGVYGLCKPSSGSFMLGDSPLPFGGNMAVRMDVQKRFMFNEMMGRKGGQLLAGEEADLVSRILRDGGEGRWVSEACVQHLIPPRMLTLSYVRRYFHDFGASLVLKRLGEEPDAREAPTPIWVWRDAIQQEFLFRIRRMLRRPAQSWIRNLRLAAFAQGTLRGRPTRSDSQ